MDSLSVRLGTDLVAARLKSIEQGTFWLRTPTAHLDLSKADSMSSLSLLSNTGDGANEFMISNAASVTSLAISGAQDDQFFVNGLDTEEHRSLFVSASGGQLADVDLSSATDAALQVMKVKLLGAWLNLSGDAVSAQTLAISLWGRPYTSSSLNVDAGDDIGYRRVTVVGRHDSFDLTGSAVLDLESYDATRSKALWNWAEIGGDDLTSVKGSKGDDTLAILSIGGTGTAPALVDLGIGNDDVTINFAFDAETQAFDGGDGEDTIELSGAAEDFASAAKNFENVQINDASGLYDVGGMNLLYATLHGASSAVTIDGLADGVELGVTGAFQHGLIINVASAEDSTTDDLHFVIYEVGFGGSSVGLDVEHLSNLEIETRSDAAGLHIAALGASDDAASVAITGTGRLDLHATNGSTSYVSSLVIMSSAGADLSGLASAAQFFVAAGATIMGGSGDDVLVGGAGADTISTGTGDNIVHASLGADGVTLGGDDTLIFTSSLQSSYGVGHDTITGFGVDDVIDVSALFASITFAGNFSSDSQGLAALSDGEPTAYFNTTTQRLYIDANFDLQMTADADMEIELAGLASFHASYLIS